MTTGFEPFDEEMPWETEADGAAAALARHPSADRWHHHPPLDFADPEAPDQIVAATIERFGALGGGCEIVLACDLAIASENASFGLPEPRVGLLALGGGLHRIPRQVPTKHAMGMLLTGRRVPAAEAQRMGMVNEVVPEGEALAGARRWAEMILECAPLSVRASKRVALETVAHATLEEAIDEKYPSVHAVLKSDDFVEGPLAFAQKRKPNWKGN